MSENISARDMVYQDSCIILIADENGNVTKPINTNFQNLSVNNEPITAVNGAYQNIDVFINNGIANAIQINTDYSSWPYNDGTPKNHIVTTSSVDVRSEVDIAQGMTVHDPDNYTAFEFNATDGNELTFIYNNQNFDPNGFNFIIDMTTPTNVNACQIVTRYPDTATNSAIRWSISGSNVLGGPYTDIIVVQQQSTTLRYLNAHFPSTVNYQYYKYTCLELNSSPFNLIGEVRLYNITQPKFSSDPNIVHWVDGDVINVANVGEFPVMARIGITQVN